MKDLHEFRKLMKAQWQLEKSNRSLVLMGRSLEEILAQAAIELSLPIHKLDYEIQTTGRKGFLFGTMGQRNWRVLVYPARKHIVTNLSTLQHAAGADMLDDEADINIDKDGVFGFRLTKEGKVMLKVLEPQGNGKKVAVADVLQRANQARSIPSLKESLVTKIVEEGNGIWVEVAEYNYNTSVDYNLSVSISEDDMKATVTLTTPGLGGSTVSYDELKQALQRAGVYHGIKEDVLNDLEMNPIYKTAVIVAQGTPAVAGEDTRLQCIIDSDISEQNMHVDAKGSIDFKRMTMIQSVASGEVIAKVLPPRDGVPGTTVRGSMIAAENGKNLSVNLGNNVALTDDGTEVVATSNGQVIFKNDVISVESIYTVDGDLKSHIDFLGTVVINGNIEDGYEVKAKDNITVTGSVGRSQLTAGGDIIVGNGINGNKYGDGTQGEAMSFVKAGKSLWASFIQNSYVEVHEMVIVSDGILNSEITALKKILCKGKRAAIVGGRIRAVEEINAVVFGSNSGTSTRLEVGVNPKLKDMLKNRQKSLDRRQTALFDLQRIVDNWSEAARSRPLSPEKKKKYDEMIAEVGLLREQIKEDKEKIIELTEELGNKHIDAKIGASMRIHSGVEILIGDSEYLVSREFNKGQTFYLDEDMIKIKDYEEITDDITIKSDNDKRKRYTKNSVKLV
ncbi:FapA family protein [Entomospira nematocerorum]|uniref:FapA family protein n=1 Tax=Entomospira nematocerorum TaxID=2719987 RepID=A0A968GAR7_9SPIO|nr:FapA family protein [Entomospira nematocera]NIZ46445.1 FapA family protein [Entomospira nematocera]WDI33753.1 FapA family protein [Entomospira nematocera]